MKWTIWKTAWALLVMLAIVNLLTGCWSDRREPVYIVQEYIRLKQGDSFVAPRDMVLATEATLQKKNEMIADLIRALRKLEAAHDLGD